MAREESLNLAYVTEIHIKSALIKRVSYTKNIEQNKNFVQYGGG
jgi:hypothetical protein